ncbi:hypothetical protein GCM10027199_13040 [Amycolatopsis magusensis]
MRILFSTVCAASGSTPTWPVAAALRKAAASAKLLFPILPLLSPVRAASTRGEIRPSHRLTHPMPTYDAFSGDVVPRFSAGQEE